MIDYRTLAKTIQSLTEGETDTVALMATVASEIHHADARIDWTGFYRVTGPEMLKIGPYQGNHGCLTIPFSHGICGAAARTGKTQLVPDVDAYPGHIAGANSTKSELVIPIIDGADTLIGIFDIDSNQANAFTLVDASEIHQILSSVFGNLK